MLIAAIVWSVGYLFDMPHMANKYFLTAKIKMSAGMTRMKPPANLRCKGAVSKFCKRKAVSVRF